MFNNKENKIGLKRVCTIKIFYICIVVCLIVRLTLLQIYPSAIVSGEGENYQSEILSQINYRILDTNGKDLMSYNKKYILVLDVKPFMLNNYEETLQDLMALNFIMKTEDINFNYSDIMKESGKIYYTVSQDTYDKVNKLKNIKGIYTYVYNELDRKEAWKSNNFLSYINDENIEEDSLEYKINSYIKDNEFSTAKFTLNEKSIYNEGEISKDSNKNIKLTIDSEIEDKIRKILNKDDYSFLKNVGVVVSEASTGKIKAMVQKDETIANVNLGIGDLGYEPGSTFKVLTEAVALDEGLITLDDKFNCVGNICSKNGEPYGHGLLSVQDALKVSCNDVFAQVGQKIGYEDMMKYLDKMNFFKPVLGLKGENRTEASGVRPKEEGSMNNISIGQITLVTPIQMAGLYNTIANNGVYVKPSILEAIVDDDGNVIESFDEQEVRVFSETAAKLTKENMRKVIFEGSGYEAKVEGTNIGGKTGTATGNNGTNHGWFAGFFEKEDKLYTIIVIAPNIGEKHPDGRELGGGNTGAPIFREIVDELLK